MTKNIVTPKNFGSILGPIERGIETLLEAENPAIRNMAAKMNACLEEIKTKAPY